MNKLKKYISLALLCVIMLSSCKKAIETTPRQSIDIETALNTKENINAAITSVYARLKSARVYGRDLIAFPEALADNGRFTNRSGRFANEARNIHQAHFADWQNLYYAINEANLVLDAIPNLNVTPAPTVAEKNAWEGQVQFLRALLYFELARQYAYIPGAVVASQDKGGVPLLKKGVKTLSDAMLVLPSRAPIADVYAFIYKDLEEAETKLSNIGTSPATANKQAAQALLARVALYNKDYAKASEYASRVITNAGSKLLSTSQYVNAWRTKVNPESLFEVTFTINAENIGVNESLQTSFTTLVIPGNRSQTGGFGDLIPTNSLLADLGITVTGNSSNAAAITARNTDVRNLLFELGTTGRGQGATVECTKYLGKNGSINLDNAIVLRIAEMFLIRAEAKATAGSTVFNETEAKADLVKLKENRYTGYTGSAIQTSDNALTGTALLNEVLKQRRIEFAFEGHRFFDLKRLGANIVKTPHSTDILFTDYRILPNIPAREVDGNSELKQNFGY